MNNFKGGSNMETTQKERRKGKSILQIVGISMFFILGVVSLIVFLVTLHTTLFIELHYPEEEYVAMEQFAEEVMVSNRGIDEEKLILDSKWDYQFTLEPGYEDEPVRKLTLTSLEQSKVALNAFADVYLVTRVDEAYHVISHTRSHVDEKDYQEDYYTTQIFFMGITLMCFLFAVLQIRAFSGE